MIGTEILKSLKIFKETSDDALGKLSQAMEEKKYSNGDVILKEGDMSGSLYLLTKGRVTVEKKIDPQGGKTKTVARLEREEFFGEMAFLENQPHSATIVALEDTEILRLPRKALDELFKKDSKTALEQVLTLFGGMSARLRRTTNELVTVFDIARNIVSMTSLQELMEPTLEQLVFELGEGISAAFYRWNMFNDEYTFVAARGESQNIFPLTLEPKPDLIQSKGEILFSHADSMQKKEGLFVYYAVPPAGFEPGDRQLIETVAAVMAPALMSFRHRDEEASRLLLEQSRQRGYSS